MKCQQKTCSSEAVVKVMWPGQPTDMCENCATKAAAINSAMGGLPLPMVPLSTPIIEVHYGKE